jgi:hypothetical protein
MYTAGNKDDIAFVIHPPIDTFFDRQIDLWLSGIQLVTPSCWIPSALSAAQQFVQQLELPDPIPLQIMVDNSTEDELFQIIDSVFDSYSTINGITPKSLYHRFFSRLDEMTDFYSIFVFSYRRNYQRVIWRGTSSSPVEHLRPHNAIMQKSAFQGAIEGLFAACEAHIDFTNKDWGQWAAVHQ